MRLSSFTLMVWLPTATCGCTLIGALLLGTVWWPLGWFLLLWAIYLLWFWRRRTRTVLGTLDAFSNRRSENWDDLPRMWSDLEQENIALKEHARREDQLRRNILTSLDVGIILIGPQRQIVTFNPAAQRLLGSSSNAFFKGTVTGLLNDPESLGMFDKAFAGGTSAWNRERAGRILSFHATPLAIETAASLADCGVLLAIQDITQQEALEQIRQKFISNASHELKTPVTSIRVAAENLVDDGWIHPQGEGNIKIILRNVDRMVLLLDDITELSRIETGSLKLEYAPFEIQTFLKDVIENASPLAKHKKIGLSLDIDPRLIDQSFLSDPLRLNQLLENLLSNAIKFSPEMSEVGLAARLGEGWVAFSVTDNGPGISPKDSPRIFERFYRTQTARAVPGTGLGLAIVKHLSRQMGGEVSFESIPNQVTTFSLRLPWRQ